MKTKQILTTMLCVCTLFNFTACGKSKPKPNTNTQANKSNVPPYLEDYDPNYPYICNRVNNLYHLTTCPDLAAQESKIFIYYKSEEEAKQKGYTPCETCLP